MICSAVCRRRPPSWSRSEPQWGACSRQRWCNLLVLFQWREKFHNVINKHVEMRDMGPAGGWGADRCDQTPNKVEIWCRRFIWNQSVVAQIRPQMRFQPGEFSFVVFLLKCAALKREGVMKGKIFSCWFIISAERRERICSSGNGEHIRPPAEGPRTLSRRAEQWWVRPRLSLLKLIHHFRNNLLTLRAGKHFCSGHVCSIIYIFSICSIRWSQSSGKLIWLLTGQNYVWLTWSSEGVIVIHVLKKAVFLCLWAAVQRSVPPS